DARLDPESGAAGIARGGATAAVATAEHAREHAGDGHRRHDAGAKGEERRAREARRYDRTAARADGQDVPRTDFARRSGAPPADRAAPSSIAARANEASAAAVAD